MSREEVVGPNGSMSDLRAKTVRAGLFNGAGRAATLAIRIASLMVFARLLEPADYGLVAMVTAFTGMLGIFSGFGLFQAAVQRDTLTNALASTLFWANLLFGALLTLAVLALAPAVSAFYHEPRLLLIAGSIATVFVITGAGVQHAAHLQRQMRFGTVALIEVAALSATTAIAIGMAWAGWGYWALVASAIGVPLATTTGLWLASGWVPGLPRRNTGLRSMLYFGGTMTLNGMIDAVVTGLDKLLLGRLWGADALGIYARAQHLSWFPCDNINLTLGEVAFAALSRAKGDPARLKRYFLEGYALILEATVPLAAVCALLAEDLIAVALGPKWDAVAPLCRVFSVAILVTAIVRPTAWLMTALGLVKRGLQISLLEAPVMIVAFCIGALYGPGGMAVATSAAMALLAVPIVAWAVHGTGIRLPELAAALARPMVASLAAAIVSSAAHAVYGPVLALVPRLGADLGVFGATYVGVLLLAAGRRAAYLALLRSARAS
jgi:O-antigen/teichoic acid export membrane protein